MKSISNTTRDGFTIVELLIVIVVIAILAAASIAGYSGIQERARLSKVASDLTQLERAIIAGRSITGGTLIQLLQPMTNAKQVGTACWGKPNGTDLSALPKTDGCWTDYYEALTLISDKSGIDVKGITDPWGRPYFMDPNEGETMTCTNDRIGMYKLPHVSGGLSTYTMARYMPFVTTSCL